MFSIALFSLASLALSALASPLAYNGLSHSPDTIEKKVEDGAKAAHHKAHDTIPAVPHVRRNDAVQHLTAFLGEFEVPLAKFESIMNAPPDAKEFANVMRPALGNLITPMTKFVGHAMARSGVSVEDNTVAVDSQDIVQTVSDYARRLTICLSKASDMAGNGFPDITLTIQTVATMFSAAVYSIATVSGIAISLLSPVFQTLGPLVNKLGVCATSSLSV